MALDHLAEVRIDKVPLLVEDRVDRIDLAEHTHDRELFLVQRIADEVALHRRRILHEACAVESSNRVFMRNAGGDDLAATGIAGHEVGFYKARRDAEVRLYEAPVELDRRAPSGSEAQVDVRLGVTRVVVLHPHGGEDPRIPDYLRQLLPEVRTMQPGRHEDTDLLGRNAPREHALDQRPQEQMVGNGPSDIADQDAGAATAANQLIEGEATQRFRECVFDGRVRVWQPGQRRLGNHSGARTGGQRDAQAFAAVQHVNLSQGGVDVHGSNSLSSVDTPAYAGDEGGCRRGRTRQRQNS